MTTHHQFMLEQLLHHLAVLEQQIECFDGRIEEALRPFVQEPDLQRLDAIPGVNRHTIEDVVAEIGVNMSVFPTSEQLASWAGLCPGNEESAGKRRRTRTTKGDVWLRRALHQAAWAAARTKDTYFVAQYRRLAGRRGKKRAVVAVAHSLLQVIYYLLKDNTTVYQELGGDYFDHLDPNRIQRYLVKRLESLGFDVTLAKRSAA